MTATELPGLFPSGPIQNRNPDDHRTDALRLATQHLAAQRHSPTSREAAERIEPQAETLRARVLEFLRYCGSRGATDQEMQAALGMDPSTERPRRVELVNAGLVTAMDGETRPTFSGRQAQVWRAVE